MGTGKHHIKKMTTWSAAVIYVHSFLAKKCVFRPIFSFFIAAQQGGLDCSYFTFPFFVFENKKAKPITLCFQLQRLFTYERCSKDTFLH